MTMHNCLHGVSMPTVRRAGNGRDEKNESEQAVGHNSNSIRPCASELAPSIKVSQELQGVVQCRSGSQLIGKA